ncbi:hypothetical protein IWQ49_001491 [Labrenzia sp. EL_126]|nr:hypothetical protein [Labrenzia sp. EL_126]
MFLFGSTSGLAFLALIFVSLIFRKRWLCVLSATLSFALAIAVIGDWIFEWGGRVRKFALAEGCLTPPYAIGSILLAVSAICLLIAVRGSFLRT